QHSAFLQFQRCHHAYPRGEHGQQHCQPTPQSQRVQPPSEPGAHRELTAGLCGTGNPASCAPQSGSSPAPHTSIRSRLPSNPDLRDSRTSNAKFRRAVSVPFVPLLKTERVLTGFCGPPLARKRHFPQTKNDNAFFPTWRTYELFKMKEICPVYLNKKEPKNRSATRSWILKSKCLDAQRTSELRLET
ncbi:UNVERIFIED_CONTAM: hypothetical protein K2H54_052925, partial [Gekko kuhli]